MDLARLALDDGWRAVLDGVARARGWPTTADAARLGAEVARLSAAYNDRGSAAPRAEGLGAARLGFSFPRDVPKAGAAVRELLAVGALAHGPSSGRPIRVLDVGAGLGATTFGVARALGAATIEATLVDQDRGALDVARALAAARAARGPGPGEAPEARVAVRTEVQPADAALDGAAGAHDLVVLGQVLSELDREAPDDVRADRHAALCLRALEACAPGGALVVVEPALRDRTRHLHRVRDRLAARGAPPFSPCLRDGPCPMLASPADWCHEDLAVDLPPWLVPVARAAGLRWQGLTFAALVVRKDGLTLRAALGRPALRAVSTLRRTKGKTEATLCGEGGARRAQRLDRDAREENAAWDAVARGDVVALTPEPAAPASPDAPARVGPGTRVERLTPAPPHP